MDINELESFKLSDAVKFHKELNPRLWQDNKLDREVRDQLLLIAEDFVEYLGISNLKVKDITISGSNAAYSYTPHSDLDLHVLVDFNDLPDNEVYQELFTAKKTLYNDAHDITVHGVPVELYVQDINQPVQSLGEYSIVHDKWIRVPKKRRANFDQAATKLKYEKLGDLIELALQSKDPKRVNDTIALVKRYRKSGLDKTGEFGPENLAYKAVRKQGLVQALYDLKSQLHAEKLSIEEDTGSIADEIKSSLGLKQFIVTEKGDDLYLDSIIVDKKDQGKGLGTKALKQLISYADQTGKRIILTPGLQNKTHGTTSRNRLVKFYKQFGFKENKGRSIDFAMGAGKMYRDPIANEDYDPNGPPPGPEFKPTMPKGTVRVDVSDVYDWYKLGQHISNMKGLGKHDFGKGPPSTVMSFGDEDLEHQYIKALAATGLDTTDIDPASHKKIKGQKTDPTYNVNESPRTFAPQQTPVQKLVDAYSYFTTLGNIHLDKQGKTPEAQQQLLALVQRLNKDGKVFAGMDKQRMESNRDTILNHIHQMMSYAIPILKKYLPADLWDAKRSQINSVLTAYNAARQVNEEILDETAEENQIVNVVSNIAAAHIAKVMKAKESKLLALLDGGLSPKEKLELFGVKVKDLNVPNVNNPLLKKLFNILYIKVNSQVDFYDDPSAPRTLGGYYDGEYTVELFFPALEYVAGKRESQLKSEIASTLAHEIQHAIDDYKSDNKVYAGSNISPAKDMQGYLKLPYEVNARFQEATMDIAKYIAMPKNDGSKTTQADLPELIRYAFEKNRLDKIYEKNQKEYKRLLTRAYKFFQAELNSPKKSTPIPQNIAKRALNWILGKQTKEINEASGYIPSAKEKNDPRFKTALTVDVKPDSIKKNAKAFNWKTSRAGIPPQARPDGKIAEDLMREWKSFLAEDEQSSKRIHMINQEFDGASLDGYVVDTDQVQLGNYLESQGANPAIAKKLAQQYNRIGIIKNMWVDEEERNQGLGTDLVSNAIDDAYLNGAEAVVLVSDEGENNEFNLTKWYESFGFKKIGMAGTDPIMLLTKSLSEADEQQGELFPGYDEKHREKRLDNWLQNTHAWDGHKPRVFYHATTKDFDTFNTHGTGFSSALGMAFEVERHGSFFAVDPKFAESFIEDPNRPGQYKDGGRIIPVYLSIQNPIDLRDNNLSYMVSNEDTVEGFKQNDIDLNSVYSHFSEYDRWELFDGPEGAEFVDNLQKLGFDGAIINERPEEAESGEVWVAFNPNQVKAIHNRGSFSPDDPRLMKESSTEETVYHVSKASNRDSIMTRGLTPRNQEDLNIHRKPGVYFFKSLADAKEWAHWGKLTYNEPYDIWKVDLPKTHQIAKDTHPEMRDFSSYVTYESIPPKNVDLI